MRKTEEGFVDARELVDVLFAEYFTPRPVVHVDEWADAERVLPKQTSAEAGPYRTDRTPYARQIMRDLSDDFECEDVVLMMSTQLVKSEVGLNWLGSIITQTPAPIMVVQATVDTAKRYSRQRIAPMVDACPALKRRVKPVRSRGGANTLQEKEFPGGRLVITGSNSAAGLASMPARFVHFDERDDYQDDVSGQGEPTMIARARQDSFPRRKRLTSSSPKRAKGYSRIEAEFMAGTRFYYHVPCPHCRHAQVLDVLNPRESMEPLVQLDDGDVRYRCEACAALIEEWHKPEMFARGEWVAQNPGAKVRSYHLNSLYSPLGWLSWRALVVQHAAALKAIEAGDEAPFKTFLNTRLAKTYEEPTDRLLSEELKGHAEDYPLRLVPAQAVKLTAGIDTQDNRFEVSVYAYGPTEESWLVDHVALYGDPADEQHWAKLAAYLDSEFEHESGARLRIDCEAIDTGGHFTDEVYRFCFERRGNRRTFAIKGAVRPGLPIKGRASLVDINWRGKVIPKGLKLYLVGTDTAKNLLHNRLRMPLGTPGKIHLSRELPDEYFAGMTSEQRVRRRLGHRDVTGWEKITHGARNEPWDCAVYALFAARVLDLHRYTDTMWERAQAHVVSLAEQQQAKAKPPPPPKEPPARRGSFVTGWRHGR